ncbi:hypothetical protein Tco_1478300, partial [Tanacetum coccineum]
MECDIRKPIWYLDSGCSRHMTGVKSYLHKYVEQPGPKVVFEDDSTCTTEGYGSIECNEKQSVTLTNIVMIAPRALAQKTCSAKFQNNQPTGNTKQTSSIKKCLHLLHMDLFRPVTPRSINHEKYTLVIVDEYSRYQVNSIVVSLIEPYERPEPAVIDTDGSYNQNDQADQNDHS